VRKVRPTRTQSSSHRHAKFVPHALTDEENQRRPTSRQDFIQTCQDNPSFLHCIATGDEPWVFQYDLETKRQNIRWASKSSSRRTFRLKKSKIKIILIIFFDKQGVTDKESVPEGKHSIVLTTLRLSEDY
jgi:hypothetical protein